MENNMINVEMSMEKIGKKTVKFVEVVADKYAPRLIGNLYIDKSMLSANGYASQNIKVTITNGENEEDIPMKEEKITDGTVMFTEVPENDFAPVAIGNLYVNKFTLAMIGYHGGNISVGIEF